MIRHRVSELIKNKSAEEEIFGKVSGIAQKSKIKFNDAYAVPDTIKTAVRYSTAINPVNQTAKNGTLNNMEVVEKGVFKAGFIFRNYETEEMKSILKALSEVNTGLIRFGGKVSRGFGKMRIDNFVMRINNGFNEMLEPDGEVVFRSIEEAAEYFGKAE